MWTEEEVSLAVNIVNVWHSGDSGWRDPRKSRNRRGSGSRHTSSPSPLVTGSWDTEFVQFRASDQILTKLCPEGGKLLIHHSFNPTQYKLYICELWPRLAVEVCVSILWLEPSVYFECEDPGPRTWGCQSHNQMSEGSDISSIKDINPTIFL